MIINKFRQLDLNSKLEYIKQNISDKVGNKKIIALASGGKDSTLALYLAHKAGLNISMLLNFTHSWTWKLYKPQLERLAANTSIPIKYIDFSKQILKPIPEGLIGFIGIPCKFCKKKMFSTVYNIASTEDYSVILSGYNLMDDVSKLILNILNKNRMDHDYMEFNNISKYEDDYRIMELRPVIRFTDEEVLQALELLNIKVERTHEANTQFEYWREGCPMQYIDRDIPINEELLEKSRKFNHIISRYAKKKGIRASIFVPSNTIVTIPAGYERGCRKYLIESLGM